MSLPPCVALKKALRSSELTRGSGRQTRHGAGSQSFATASPSILLWNVLSPGELTAVESCA